MRRKMMEVSFIHAFIFRDIAMAEVLLSNQNCGKEVAMMGQALLQEPAAFIHLPTCESIGKRHLENLLAQRKKKRKRTRISRPRCASIWDTNWGKLLTDPDSLKDGTVK